MIDNLTFRHFMRARSLDKMGIPKKHYCAGPRAPRMNEYNSKSCNTIATVNYIVLLRNNDTLFTYGLLIIRCWN